MFIIFFGLAMGLKYLFIEVGIFAIGMKILRIKPTLTPLLLGGDSSMDIDPFESSKSKFSLQLDLRIHHYRIIQDIMFCIQHRIKYFP
jgi:hypothetical protein